MYVSPLPKLARFFRLSRDAWKAKCQAAREEVKLRGNQVRAVEKSREHWRRVAQEAQRRQRELERELELLKCDTAGGTGRRVPC